MLSYKVRFRINKMRFTRTKKKAQQKGSEEGQEEKKEEALGEVEKHLIVVKTRHATDRSK